MAQKYAAQRKKFGERNFHPVVLVFSDQVYEVFKNYKLDIIDYLKQNYTTIYIYKDETEDIISMSFRDHPNKFKQTLKKICNTLEKINNEIHPRRQIHGTTSPKENLKSS